ncbi:MAG: (deoxy)nucleoside triphosphate pyrophosphohydrolase [Candidatus Aureabacteria bacterium]|nr:(deoxy)nucleoside triphosphate pyrophosphohydrolase [Candidatus Auribacterota bacterium]NLW94622.1 (deoxy)nucleoside triphosphate pyrophosphohydrolase [Chlamydiota bacterium]HOE27573.1 (deoxy)nucleoside triphosphate pyrophosphohydrolase [bacterium]HQM52541.1 (deoxy)nucleoside triphosphate pyrophosphohydrolase [bacterium]
MRKTIVCAAGIIRRGDRVLIAQRKPDSSLEPLKWEFPGGKIEFAEDPRACLVREIREEMGFEIEVERIFEVASHNYRKDGEIRHVLLLCYLCTYLSGEPRPLECHDLRWVGPGEIVAHDFAAADVPVVGEVVARLWAN